MKTPLSLLPGLPRLTAGLTSALGANGSPSPVTVLRRKLPRYMYTYPNEVVTCRLPDGRNRRVFVKYEAGRGHPSFGHRGNVSYEAKVYQHLLRWLPGFRPRFLGALTEPGPGDTWLLLEFVHVKKPINAPAGRKACPPVSSGPSTRLESTCISAGWASGPIGRSGKKLSGATSICARWRNDWGCFSTL